MKYLYLGDDKAMQVLVGKKITHLYMSSEQLLFVTDKDEHILFEVEGDCCSHSYLYDFYGVKKLLNNGAITKVTEVPVNTVDSPDGYTSIQIYGYQLTTVSKEWGEMTSVFSFRNESNGYYGGSIVTRTYDGIVQAPSLESVADMMKYPLTDDIVEVKLT